MPLPLAGVLAQALPGIAGVVNMVIDRVVPDPKAAAEAKLQVLRLEQGGELEAAKVQISAILAEAQSADPWTARARPMFLYVMYAVILLCIVGGVVGVWFPAQVGSAAQNVASLLGAIPESLWWLFGTGYLGYTGARSLDKWKGAK